MDSYLKKYFIAPIQLIKYLRIIFWCKENMCKGFGYPVKFYGNEKSHRLSEKYGYKEWMITRFLNFVPDTEALLKYIEEKAENYSTYIRTNTLKISPEKLKARLTNKGYQLNETVLKEVFEIREPTQKSLRNMELVNTLTTDDKKNLEFIKKSDLKYKLPSIGSTIEYLKGYYYIQDLSSCIAVEELDIISNPELLVLDMTASPGGKTTHIAQKMKNEGILIACEKNTERVPSLIYNLSRCFVYNTVVYNINGEDIEKMGIKFDRILLDAPCTCEGLILKDSTRKTSRELTDFEICSIRQKKLIRSAFDSLKDNGILIYCTCSFAPEENEMVVDTLLNDYQEARLERLRYGSNGLTEFSKFKFSGEMNNSKRFYPHIHNTNGFFIAKIKRVEEGK